MSEIKVLSVSQSSERGVKKPVKELKLNDKGIIGDVHAGSWNRQISIIDISHINRFKELTKARDTEFGEFAENITTEGITLYTMKPGDILNIADVKLEITQIGKKCHGDGCAIFSQVGKCVMPKEGIFAKVLKTGKIKSGDGIIYTSTE